VYSQTTLRPTLSIQRTKIVAIVVIHGDAVGDGDRGEGADQAWIRRALQTLIQQQYGLSIPLRTLSDYPHEWGFSSQKPMMQAYQQSPEAVGDWLLQDYPQIEVQAKQEQAEIHWGDEAGLATQEIGGKSFAPRGQTPVLRTKRPVLIIIRIGDRNWQ
jgi:hypothetical protein